MLKFSKLLMVSVLAFMLVIAGCSESESPTQPATQSPEMPDGVSQQIAQAEQYQHIIDMMDPHVSTADNGEFIFDEAGFAEAHSGLSADEQRLVIELKGGIPIVNQQLSEMADRAAAKVWFQWYWWGYKECYSQLSAEYMLEYMNSVSWGKPLWAWANYYYYYYGYFCINHTWAGGIWISL